MGNCLVTRLNESVQNDNLLKIGELKLLCGAGVIMLRHGVNVTITFENAVDVLDVVGTTVATNVTSYLVTADNPFSFVVKGDNVVNIPDKYNIQQLSFGKTSTPIDYVEFKGLSTLQNASRFYCYANSYIKGINLNDLSDINFSNAENFILKALDIEVTGDISVFAEQTALSEITINTLNDSITNVTGDITSLNTLTALNVLNLRDTQVAGNADAFLTALASSGRTADLIIVLALGMTFLGVTGRNNSVAIKFNSSMVNPTAEDTARGWQVAQ